MKRSLLLCLVPLLLTWTGAAQATEPTSCSVEGVLTDTSSVTDVLGTGESLWVATTGGIAEYDRSNKKLRRRYTTLDGLPELRVQRLSESTGGQLIADTRTAQCRLFGETFRCTERTANQPVSPSISLKFWQGRRVTAEASLKEGPFLGTATNGAFLNGAALNDSATLPGAHVTSLAYFRGELFIGTFNSGLSTMDRNGILEARPGAGQFVNALLGAKRHLYVGTSRGLFRSRNGRDFSPVALVTDAVVGLATDETSIWVSTPGAVYRIKDGPGPASDVWWIPGSSHSLQKVSAQRGVVWLGTEDRGAVRMQVGPRVMARDKPFSVFDRTGGLPSSWSLSVAALPDGGALMTTLREGVVRIAPDGSFRAVQTGISDWGLAAVVDGSGVWIGSQGGASYFDLKSETSTPIRGLPDQRVHAFVRDPNSGRLYIGTENGLAWCKVR